jgi:putative radical SAM enzyme (TIGR03279 family)
VSEPKVAAIAEASPAATAGILAGDELVSLNGRVPRDVIAYSQIMDEAEVDVLVRRSGAILPEPVRIQKGAGEPVGLEVSSPVFDRVRTCDNHCAFCFIHQLPKGMRRSLYVKDDDYRLSFLYGNFTTLTRFTELDAERVIDERLGPLYVSIHATDPDVRAHMLRNPRGATSLRWLRVLLDAGIEVHGQVVVCPGVNDGPVLEDTLAGILDEYPRLASVGVVPLGISRFTREPELRPHTVAEAEAVCDLVGEWQCLYERALGRRVAHAADEYFLMAGRAFPRTDAYEGLPQHENGIGMAAAFADAFRGHAGQALGTRSGFFASVDGAPAHGYRSPRSGPEPERAVAEERPVRVLTGTYGAEVLGPLVDELVAAGGTPSRDVAVVPVENRFFGGNIGVTGLLTGSDISRALEDGPEHGRYLVADSCLSGGRFLDGADLAELPRPVEVVASDGRSLRRALGPAGGEAGAAIPSEPGSR